MITILAGTNRVNSRTALVAQRYSDILMQKNVDHKLLTLEALPKDFVHEHMYTENGLSDEMIVIQEEFILPAQKFFVLVPEYNGGMPGIFKLFIDAICARNYLDNFSKKKISLTGIAAGRGGNLRGMESLTGIFNYLGAIIQPSKLPLSDIEKLIENNELTEEAVTLITIHIESFLEF